ncbi:molybdopterin biosynthesis protein [Bacillaceae bacterium S4-13-56]
MGEKNFKRTIYLEDKPRNQALSEWMEHNHMLERTEFIPVEQALHRVTAKPIFASQSVPHYHASAMDGIAVIAETTYEAHEKNPIQLTEGKDFVYVDTGHKIPSPFDSVIMIEHVNEVNEGVLEIIEPATPWQHIRPIGEDIMSGSVILPMHHQIRPVDIGALYAAGKEEIEVLKIPIVSIIPTGSELVERNPSLQPGKITEFNSKVFAGYVKEWGGIPKNSPITKDDPESIKKALLEATMHSDIVIINAGSSAGSKDYTVHVIAELGVVYTHGVATRPGKPVILGKINETFVIGLPGYPISAYLAMEWFVKPLLYDYFHLPLPKRDTLKVKMGRRIVSTMGAEDFVRVSISLVNGEYIANPLTRAAGVTMSLVQADGLLVVPSTSLGIEQGEEVEIELLQSIEKINSSISIIGSHDPSLDLLSAVLKMESPPYQLQSSHVGSMAGIIALKKGEAEVVTAHLLDEKTGAYNIPFIERFLKGQELVYIPFLRRMQGWYVTKERKEEFRGLEDLLDGRFAFINRQKGAGTRLLFDSLLKDQNVSPDSINGYDREMFSHLSVAAEVKESANTVGLGVYSASKIMDIEFLPVAEENYDIIMTKSIFDSERGKMLLSAIRSPQFKKQLDELGGYRLSLEEPFYLST